MPKSIIVIHTFLKKEPKLLSPSREKRSGTSAIQASGSRCTDGQVGNAKPSRSPLNRGIKLSESGAGKEYAGDFVM